MQDHNANRIALWEIDVGEPEIEEVARAIRSRKVAQGAVTEEFQTRLAALLGVAHVSCTTSGTAALMLAYLAIGLRPGDEIIIPDRTFVATMNAAQLLGVNVQLVDVCADRPLIDPARIEARITPRTRAIVAVHLNGRAADVDAIQAIADRHGLAVIEDAAQAFLSKTGDRWLGACSRFGCFSLGMAKLLTTGQGGFVACHTAADYDQLQKLKNQGVFDVTRGSYYGMVAGNFKFTDVQAAIGLAQLQRLPARVERQNQIYHAYRRGLASVGCLRCVEVRTEHGELPLRAEFLCTDRARFASLMNERGVPVLLQPPSLHESPLVSAQPEFVNSELYSRHLLTLPCGPDQPLASVEQVIAIIHSVDASMPSWPAQGRDERLSG